MKQKKSITFKIIRYGLLALILIGSIIIHYLHINQGVKYPSIHSICPFGGIENLWAYLAGRANIAKIFSGTMILFFLTVVFALIFRRSFCGNICPFGAFQEFLGKIIPKKFKIPVVIDKYLAYLKYVLLVLSVVMAWITMSLWISPYDPWAAFGHLSTGAEVFNEYAVGTIILIIITILSFVINRPFCRYLCPAGALYALIGKISPSVIERDPNTCINCKSCTKSCPVDIEVHKAIKVTTGECISCNACVDACPKPGVMLSSKISKFKLKPLIVIISSVVIFFGSLFILDKAGLYVVSVPTEEEIIEKKDYIGISDLRGSMSIETGAFYTGKDLKEFYMIMEIPESVPKETLLKNVNEYVPGYDFHAVKARKE